MASENKLYSRSQIRAELYDLWNRERMQHNDHLVEWYSQHPGEPHPRPCGACSMYQFKRFGINDAIRHFGGRVRRTD
jgi:hypothetical protein